MEGDIGGGAWENRGTGGVRESGIRKGQEAVQNSKSMGSKKERMENANFLFFCLASEYDKKQINPKIL